MTAKEARGLRNNNPGNIEKSKDPWQGLADKQPDKRFFTFSHAKWGIRAIARILITYQDKHRIKTIEGIINRWAPPVENNTTAYVNAVAKAAGKAPRDHVDMQDYNDLMPIVKAIIHHENGKQPYSQAVIDEGLKLAGVQKPVKAAVKDPVAGNLVAAGAAGALGEIEPVKNALFPLVGSYQTVDYIFLALTLTPIAFLLLQWWVKRGMRKA